MGSHGYGRFKAAVKGSPATRIAATGDVPLLIIRQACRPERSGRFLQDATRR